MSVKELRDMAVAHLENVKQRIGELHSQKQFIENEIQKLVEYYETHVKLLDNETLEKVNVD